MFDVIIIGGGISGLGVAREAASAGYSTLLLESGTCGSATSNNTLRIIHGGFRYLQNLDLPRVVRSLNDQSALINDVPGSVQPLPCLMPLTRFGVKSRIPVTCAAILYGSLMRANRSPLPAPHIISSQKIYSTVKILRDRAPHGALCWYDGVMIDPNSIIKHLVSQTTCYGAQIRESTPVNRVEGSRNNFIVRAHSGESWNARCVVNTIGPWIDGLEVPVSLQGHRPKWCKGFNLIIKQQLDSKHGIGIESADGRLFFCVPRGTGTAIGTWYLPHTDFSTSLTVSEHEIAQFLHSFNASLPDIGISKNDIAHIDVGILPMGKVAHGGPRLISHERIHEKEGYIEVMSTKYTTFRSQGKAVLGAIRRSFSAT